MKTEVHAQRSMEAIVAEKNDFYLKHKETIDRMIPELHNWIDHFFAKKGDGYDYTGLNVMKHWQERHHSQGIGMAASHFAEIYGEEYRSLIEQEAQRHIIDDLGEVPDEQFYRQIGIWKQLRGF